MNTINNTVTMTTVEIAELTGKRHDNVLRDARAVVSQVNALKSEAIEATYTDGRGREKPMLVLDKHLLIVLKVDLSSPSGLVWTETNLKRKAGAKAGSLSNGYWIIGWKGTTYRAHRLIWEMLHGPIPEGRVIDHIDGNRANNDPKNLRLATPAQNNQNKVMKANASLAISKNVYEARPGYFQVIVKAHGMTHRSNSKDETEAHWMAHILREHLHGHFMRD